MKYFQFLVIIPLTFLLSSCYVTPGCIHYPQSVDCSNRKRVILVQKWQKKETIGHTNTEQRRKDFQDCGVKQYKNGVLDLNVRYDGMSSIDRANKIEACMIEKGYYEEINCVDYDKNEYTGLCN